jgi:hypothetical protein
MTDQAQNQTPINVVRAWEQAVNKLAIDRVLELSHPEIEIVGPRGIARGRDVLKDWLSRAGLTLETRRSFTRDEAVVNDQQGVWRDVESGGVVGEAAVASHYKVENGQVTYVARYEALDKALGEASLSVEDEVA